MISKYFRNVEFKLKTNQTLVKNAGFEVFCLNKSANIINFFKSLFKSICTKVNVLKTAIFSKLSSLSRINYFLIHIYFCSRKIENIFGIKNKENYSVNINI